MIITEEVVIGIIDELTEGGREFHTTELATALSNHFGAGIDSGVSRYWANQIVLKGILMRRQISRRLFVYCKRRSESANLSGSVTVKPREEVATGTGSSTEAREVSSLEEASNHP